MADPRFIDLTGRVFGRLTVKRFNGKVGNKNTWECVCSCGTIKIAQGGNLKSGHIKSCGCLKSEVMSSMKFKHGMSGTRLYNAWISMKNRCSNPRHQSYKWYGARGIDVSPEWMTSFKTFCEDMAPCPDEMDIDRIDNSKGYSKENCQWVPRKQNTRNTRGNVLSEYNGDMLCIAAIAEIANVPYESMRTRISNWGMNAYEAITSIEKLKRRKNK